jgi:hypothetical protein
VAQTASGGGVQWQRGCFGGRRHAWRGPTAPVWKGKESFSSNSGNGEAQMASPEMGDGGDARTESGAEEGLRQQKAGEADAGSVGKRVWCSGVDE